MLNIFDSGRSLSIPPISTQGSIQEIFETEDITKKKNMIASNMESRYNSLQESTNEECPEKVTVIRGGLDPPKGRSGFGSYFFIEISGMMEDELKRGNNNFVIIPSTDRQSSYFRKKGDMNMNKWSRFFQPVNEHLLHCIDDKNKSIPRKSLLRNFIYDLKRHLSSGRIKAWPYGIADDYIHKNKYNSTWYLENRKRGHEIVSKYHVPQPRIQKHITRLEKTLLKGYPMLGIHMRGTDKLAAGGRKLIQVEQYVPYIRSFLETFPDGGIFVATDDADMFTKLSEYEGIEFTSQTIKRETGDDTVPYIVDHKNGPETLGLEIMTDIYLLSKCDYLLYGISSVIEGVMYLNLDLHDNSINLEYEGPYRVPWE